MIKTKNDYLNELENYSQDEKEIVLKNWINEWEKELIKNPNDEQIQMLLDIFRDAKRWNVMEYHIWDEGVAQPWKRGINFYLYSYYSKEEAEIKAEEIRNDPEYNSNYSIKVKWVGPIRKSLDYQGIARLKLMGNK